MGTSATTSPTGDTSVALGPSATDADVDTPGGTAVDLAAIESSDTTYPATYTATYGTITLSGSDPRPTEVVLG